MKMFIICYPKFSFFQLKTKIPLKITKQMENSIPSDTFGMPAEPFEDNPFPVERLKEFDSKAIIDELKCEICKYIVADVKECETCQ